MLTGGIAYSALFSVFAGLTLGWSLFMAVLGGDAQLRQQVLDAIDASLPGLVDTGSGGVIQPDDLRLSPALTVAGVVALVVLLVSAMTAMAALRTGVRAMFGEQPTAGNALLAQARALAGFLGMALAILLSAVLSIATTSAADWMLGVIGAGAGADVAVRVIGLAVAFVVDAAVFVMVLVVLADQRPPRRELLAGAAIAAFGIGVVRYLGTAVVAGSVTSNRLLAPFAVIVTLLIWINLISRIVLLASAWVADPPLEDDDVSAEGEDVRTRA
ncbi:YihY/virulence factor BrkB family protein [Actinotalea sp. M2MS4P-6]|uniref:YihY/virulence factor BrkB family protein n=1 Tax=Actinotalea sp. M2MS4P-6 TaxID=2983762 RepID=UPI0021E3C339|nr:YihY/virulence factor BrkB family protein [Actinotalea sp. M2MS4P-6]MCV2393483.1 YihY/virulence factor BrkB family protein [Actinotalea sp. M2MS4P-6]